MKRKGFFCILLIAVSVIFMPFFQGNAKKEELRDIAKPYVGVYRCKEFRFGEKDFSCYAEKATLELKGDGTFLLNVKICEGKVKERTGRYEAEKDTIVLIADGDKQETRRVFSRKNDEISMLSRLHGKTLWVVFSRAW